MGSRRVDFALKALAWESHGAADIVMQTGFKPELGTAKAFLMVGVSGP
jgi:hypothetical protein